MLTQAQIEARRNGLFGSDASVIEGTNKYKDLHTLWLEKTGQISDKVEQNLMMELGHFLEPFCVKLYKRKTKFKVTILKHTIYHEKHKFLGAHIDGRVKGQTRHPHEPVGELVNRGLECKIAFRNTVNNWGKEFSDTIPEQYRSQIKHYALVTGLKVWDVVCLNMPDAEIPIHTVKFCDEELDVLLKKEMDFWDSVVGKAPPPPINGTKTLKNSFRLRYPRAVIDSVIIADYAAKQAYLDRCAAKAEIDRLEEKRQQAENFLLEFSGDHEQVVDEEGLVLLTNKNTVKGRRLYFK